MVHQGRVALPGPRSARRGSHRGPLLEAVPVAGGVARAADPGDLRRPGRRGLPPVPRALRHPARRGEPAGQPVHPLYLVRWLPVPGTRQVRRRRHRRAPDPGPAERHPAGQRRSQAPGDGPGRKSRHVRGGQPGRPRGDLRGRHRGDRGRGRQQRRHLAPVGVRPAPGGPGQRLGPGRPQLHVPQQQGRGRPGQGAQRHGVREDPRPERLLLRRATAANGRSGTSRCAGSRTRRR